MEQVTRYDLVGDGGDERQDQPGDQLAAPGRESVDGANGRKQDRRRLCHRGASLSRAGWTAQPQHK